MRESAGVYEAPQLRALGSVRLVIYGIAAAQLRALGKHSGLTMRERIKTLCVCVCARVTYASSTSERTGRKTVEQSRAGCLDFQGLKPQAFKSETQQRHSNPVVVQVVVTLHSHPMVTSVQPF